jgi:hypothetical protein
VPDTRALAVMLGEKCRNLFRTGVHAGAVFKVRDDDTAR